MKVKIEMTKSEKRAAIIIIVVLAIFLYFYNRRYMYVLDAEFENETPISIILKTGFIIPVKTLIPIKDGFEKKVRLYGYNLQIKKSGDKYDLFVDKKKVHEIHPVSYYDKTHKSPTGRIYV